MSTDLSFFPDDIRLCMRRNRKTMSAKGARSPSAGSMLSTYVLLVSDFQPC
jgi:hypothetical protein